ncbi:MAG TPA: serine/threonine-protein kinase [Myxococcaceae bacterium]
METWHGQGAYGAVYRAVRVGQEHAGHAALKFSLLSGNRRFTREAELLSRLSHPGIPRLLDRGLLQHPSGVERHYFVMEWVEGTPLYAWAEQHSPSHRQVCRLLAQLARALEAVHAADAVHRDVKGDNVLVRHSDGQAVLIDFGSCHFQGAARLTWQSLPPGTPAYLSPQACLFDLRSVRDRNSYYPPSPADDLFALGVTAYRLVMGQYPPDIQPYKDEQGSWQVASPNTRPLLESNSWVQPLLREWILRLLSDSPEERGTAAQLAEALEAAAAEEVVPQPAVQPAAEVVPPRRLARARSRMPWLALAAAGACAVFLWTLQRPRPVSPEYVVSSTQHASESHAPDAGTTTVGDTSPTEPESPAQPPAERKPITQEAPPEFYAPQRPDKKGLCPNRKQVLINGICWAENPSMNAEECVENGYVVLKGKCFSPALEPPQKSVPTSGPSKDREP